MNVNLSKPASLPNRKWLKLVSIFTLCAVSSLLVRAQAAAPAGTSIGNQASATYSDASLVTRTVTSNTVITVVQQVASLTLSSPGTKTAAIGGQVVYPHTITNSGNGTDTFNLTASNTGTVTMTSVQYFADANGDGVPDNTTAITSTGEIPAGGVFKFVAVGTVPVSAVAGNTNTITVTAASAMTPATTATNADATTITGQAVMQVTQSIDVASGPSPASGRTITITYTNVGNTTATGVTLTELMPSGFTYATGTGRWSVTGGTQLTDADNTDNQSGVIYDYNITAAGRMTAVIASVAPGASGTISYQINVKSSLPPGANPATASTGKFSYNDGAAPISATDTNTVQYTVLASASLTVSASTVASASQGTTVNFTNIVTNTGNGSDSFNIVLSSSTFPAGTTFQLYQADGVTPLLDTNNDGIPDTGPMNAAGTYNVIVKASLPAASTGGPYTVTVSGTSKVDPTKTANGLDTLTAITTSSVDLTNNTAGGPGVGLGPEGSAVITNTVAPGGTSRFTLVVANTSATADSFNLQSSTDLSFATMSLPAGWTVVFKDSTGAVISNTGVINAGTNKTIYADVTVPAGAVAATTDLFFRAISPSSGAIDRLHDAVTIGTVRSITITPNNTGQATPGGIFIYTHTITNTGNVLEGEAVASTVTLASASNSGFSSVVYWDKNNDGVLDASDPVLTNLSALTGGTNGASTAAGLSPGESARIFVKVTSPAGAAIGAIDTTTVTATISGTVSGSAAPSPATATDTTTIIASQVTLLKKQALDAACDGTADTAFGISPVATGATPGACIRYQITATNGGANPITTLVVSDATPAYTVYDNHGAASTTVGTITAPTNGTAGTVQATVGTLTSGQVAIVEFGVKITP